ncbi:MAG: hypothetical protein NXH75_15110 [Halobacteriovoraceae bacterium]|nr:hypothetical protein [Halobacteriovoraceae bacterium]
MKEKGKLRNLPRYNILHLKPKLEFPTLESHLFVVKDVSLAGLQVYSSTRVSLKSFNSVTLLLGNNDYTLNVHQVWLEEEFEMEEGYKAMIKEEVEKLHFRSGFRLKFHSENEYNK